MSRQNEKTLDVCLILSERLGEACKYLPADKSSEDNTMSDKRLISADLGCVFAKPQRKSVQVIKWLRIRYFTCHFSASLVGDSYQIGTD
ncbi:hypothetical protein CEXT_634471 [Caerostris extrusa]|uniref:Uncharacterized protein n=1 Tax=Caerostris extrusa TaxID=172846 RepID=A0AAV4R7M2_CAEEX|nr:hypothetical protein CEXT_634471 [Caerostris extrusa]